MRKPKPSKLSLERTTLRTLTSAELRGIDGGNALVDGNGNFTSAITSIPRTSVPLGAPFTSIPLGFKPTE